MVASVNNWIVFQQRIDASVDFNLPWQNYRDGFGIPSGNFWLGLEKLFQLCNVGNCELRMEVQTVSGLWFSSEYNIFFMEGEKANYKIHFAGYSGDDTSIMTPSNYNGLLNGMSFSTKDRDQDLKWAGSCAQNFQSGWWFNNCYWVNFNGVYNTKGFAVNGGNTLLSVSRMMLKLN